MNTTKKAETMSTTDWTDTETTYRVSYTNGTTTEHTSWDSVEAELRERYPDAEIGHAGDLSDGGDRTLAWVDDASAENDDGANAVASVVIVSKGATQGSSGTWS